MAKDPYHYFRIEAHELLEALSRGLLDLEKGADGDHIRQLLRHAHTLKGAARVVKQIAIGELAHAMEGCLSPYRESAEGLDKSVVDTALKHIDRIRELLSALGEPAPAPQKPQDASPTPVKSSPDESSLGMRIDAEDMKRLQEGIVEANSAAFLLQSEDINLSNAQALTGELLKETRKTAPANRSHRIEDGLEQLQKELTRLRRTIKNETERITREMYRLREVATDLRLLPAAVLVNELERVARDTSATLGKRVTFQASGIETKIDSYVLTKIRGALRHLVSNAISHGIEEEATRIAAGKNPVGKVSLTLQRRGHRVSFLVEDDGNGFDLNSLREVAVAKGYIGKSEAVRLDLSGYVDLLLRGGMSTARTPTTLSGHGIGLDMVREIVMQCRGEIFLRSESGKGATVELILPISFSSLPALFVETGTEPVLVPLDSVAGAIRLQKEEISRTENGESIIVDDRAIPLISLHRALQRPGNPPPVNGYTTAILVSAAEKTVAVTVDRLHGVKNILVNSLPEHVTVSPVVSGCTLDDLGNPQIVLSPSALVLAVDEYRSVSEELQVEKRDPILIIDDSLTTRMLEQSILESAGYEVELSVSGEEALVKARQKQYAMFIVDVEMPGMSGFDFIEIARSDPELRSIPSILVTSRSDLDDKRRGKNVGARAFIVKSEFNQQELLQIIGSLVR